MASTVAESSPPERRMTAFIIYFIWNHLSGRHLPSIISPGHRPIGICVIVFVISRAVDHQGSSQPVARLVSLHDCLRKALHIARLFYIRSIFPSTIHSLHDHR